MIQDVDNSTEDMVKSKMSLMSLAEAAEYAAKVGALADYMQKKTIKFLETSERNRIFCQMFEVNAEGEKKKITKLDVLDMGVLELSEKDMLSLESEGIDQRSHQHKHFFYVGKVFEDEFSVPTFIRLFTLMFD